MDTNATDKVIIAAQTPGPLDLLAEGERARKLSGEVEGIKCLVEGIRCINDTVLTQVLFALWDSGFYEYSLSHARFEVEEAAGALQLDPAVFRSLMEYLVGRGIVETIDGKVGLTSHGRKLTNVLLRGTMDLYVGGYGPLLANLGRFLRKEITPHELKDLRSASHTVRGTEQLICVRTVPAVLRKLAQKRLQGILNLACRTGEFLIELARSGPTLHGIGIDKAADRVVLARAQAQHYGVDSRLQFVTSEVGRDPIPLDSQAISSIDVVTALYLLHEVNRFGKERVLDLLRQVKTAFPGRLLLFMETLPADAVSHGKNPPKTFTHLDYLLIHRIRSQGLPLPPQQWQSIVEEAGLKFIEMQDVYGSALYLAQM